MQSSHFKFKYTPVVLIFLPTFATLSLVACIVVFVLRHPISYWYPSCHILVFPSVSPCHRPKYRRREYQQTFAFLKSIAGYPSRLTTRRSLHSGLCSNPTTSCISDKKNKKCIALDLCNYSYTLAKWSSTDTKDFFYLRIPFLHFYIHILYSKIKQILYYKEQIIKKSIAITYHCLGWDFQICWSSI